MRALYSAIVSMTLFDAQAKRAVEKSLGSAARAEAIGRDDNFEREQPEAQSKSEQRTAPSLVQEELRIQGVALRRTEPGVANDAAQLFLGRAIADPSRS